MIEGKSCGGCSHKKYQPGIHEYIICNHPTNIQRMNNKCDPVEDVCSCWWDGTEEGEGNANKK